MARVDLVEYPVKREGNAIPVTPSELASLLGLELPKTTADSLIGVAPADGIEQLV